MTPTLTAQQAAEYLGLASHRAFRKAVTRGELPPPAIKSRPYLWSRSQLDKCLQGDDNEIHESDDLMVKINGLS